MPKPLHGAALAALLCLAAAAGPAAALARPAAPGPADDAGLREDVRCLVIGFSLIQKPDAEQQKFGTIISMYYFGKVDGIAPQADLESLIVEESGKMTPDVAHSDAKRCGLELTERGAALTQVGERIQKREAAAVQQAAADKAAADKAAADKAAADSAAGAGSVPPAPSPDAPQ